MKGFVEIHDSYELYEFVRQYHLDIDATKIKLPVTVGFDEKTGLPVFSTIPSSRYYITLQVGKEEFSAAANTIEELQHFLLEHTKNFEVGNIVKLYDHTKVEQQYFDFFDSNRIDYRYACRYHFNGYPSENATFLICFIKEEAVLIQDMETEYCYVTRKENLCQK